MNKTLHLIIAGIIIVSGLIGYTMLGQKTDVAHAAGDGHVETDHATAVETSAHDDGGLAPHTD